MLSLRWALPLCVLCASAAAAGPSWPDLLARAERLSDQGKNEESVAAAESALAAADKSLGPVGPETGAVLSRLSRVYETAGAAARLPEIERRLSAVEPKDYEVWFSLGKLRREEGEVLEAENAIKNALALKPSDPAAEDELAQVYDDMGRFEEEARMMEDRIKKAPREYSLYSQLARAYVRLGRYAEAKETYARARKIDGDARASAYVEEGYFYLDTGQAGPAEEDFASAIAVDTANAFGYHHMGAYLAQSRRYPEAEKYLRRALERRESNPRTAIGNVLHTMLWLGGVIEAQGRYPEAEALYLRALRKAPPDGEWQLSSLRSLAKVYVLEGKSAQAEEAYRRAAAACTVRIRCPVAAAGKALIEWGQFYLHQGRRAEAEATAERAEKLFADVPFGREQFAMLRDLAAFYASLGDVSKNAALYARLMPMRVTMPLDSDLVWVEAGLADIEAAQGRLPEAEDHYRRAIETLDHNRDWKEEADLLDALAAARAKGKDPRGAAAASEKARELRARTADPGSR